MHIWSMFYQDLNALLQFLFYYVLIEKCLHFPQNEYHDRSFKTNVRRSVWCLEGSKFENKRPVFRWNDKLIWNFQLLNILWTPFHKKACKSLLEPDLALMDNASNIALKAFNNGINILYRKIPKGMLSHVDWTVTLMHEDIVAETLSDKQWTGTTNRNQIW